MSEATTEMSDITIFSIDTLNVRLLEYKESLSLFEHFIIDEAHDCTSKSYKIMLDLLSSFKSTKSITGYTASPYRIGKKRSSFLG